MEQVTVLVQDYDGGESAVNVFDSEQKAEKYLADYCRELWEEWHSKRNSIGPLSSDDDMKAIEAFYEVSEYEFYYLETHNVK